MALLLWAFGFAKMYIGNKGMSADLAWEKFRGQSHFWAGITLVIIGCFLG